MPGWLVAVLAGAVLLVLLDRAVARGWFDHWRLSMRSGRDGGGPSGFLGDLVEIFQPTRVHTTEEQQRQELDIVRPGDDARRHPGGSRDNEPTVP